MPRFVTWSKSIWFQNLVSSVIKKSILKKSSKKTVYSFQVKCVLTCMHLVKNNFSKKSLCKYTYALMELKIKKKKKKNDADDTW